LEIYRTVNPKVVFASFLEEAECQLSLTINHESKQSSYPVFQIVL